MRIIALVLTSVLFYACERKMVNVKIPERAIAGKQLVIDENIKVFCRYDSDNFITIRLSTGNHEMRLNNGESKKFSVGENGGILNLARQEFVVFPVEYVTEGMKVYDVMQVNLPVVIDSFIVYNRDITSSQEQLFEILKDEEFAGSFSRNIIKTDSSQLFIDKTWDYDIDQLPPDKITIRTMKPKYESYKIKESKFKRWIQEEHQFLSQAQVSNVYRVEVLKNKRAMEELLRSLNED
jgi:hypothetical protein